MYVYQYRFFIYIYINPYSISLSPRFGRLIPNMFFQKRCELHVLNIVFSALCFERAVRNTGRSKKVTHAPFETSYLPIVPKAPFETLLFSGKRFERHVLNIVFPKQRFERHVLNIVRNVS
jgi:hypothetical protein